MSRDYIKAELLKLLQSQIPQVICISGEWGTGKTFIWNEIVSQTDLSNSRYEKYSYVSLFGANSITDIKFRIFSSASNFGGDRIGRAKSSYERIASFAKDVSSSFSLIRQYETLAHNIFYSSVSNYIVCIDDFERKEKNLSVTEVLGLISDLKESKNCSVVLLLNHEGFDFAEQASFKATLEKIADKYIIFNPTSIGNASIGIGEDERNSKLLRAAIVRLNITNIRLMRFIQRTCDELLINISESSDEIIARGLEVVVLSAYFKYGPSEFGHIECVKEFFACNCNEKKLKKEVTIKAKAILSQYHYHDAGEFELLIIDGVESGVFDRESIRRSAQQRSRQKLEGTLLNELFSEIDQFILSICKEDDDGIDKIIKAARGAINKLTLTQVNDVAMLFENCELHEQALALMKEYNCLNGNIDGREYNEIRELDSLSHAMKTTIQYEYPKEGAINIIADLLKMEARGQSQPILVLKNVSEMPQSAYEKWYEAMERCEVAEYARGVIEIYQKASAGWRYYNIIAEKFRHVFGTACIGRPVRRYKMEKLGLL